jgi:hypothetical protein
MMGCRNRKRQDLSKGDALSTYLSNLKALRDLGNERAGRPKWMRFFAPPDDPK